MGKGAIKIAPHLARDKPVVAHIAPRLPPRQHMQQGRARGRDIVADQSKLQIWLHMALIPFDARESALLPISKAGFAKRKSG
jgi:hypothetical protein